MMWVLWYIVVGVLLWPTFAKAMVSDFRNSDGSVDGEDYVLAALLAFGVCVIWPLAVVVWGLSRWLKQMDKDGAK